MRNDSHSASRVAARAALLSGGILLGSLGLGALVVHAQAPLPPDQLPTPRGADGHPILAGVWNEAAPGTGAGTILNRDCNSGTNREKCQTSDFIDFVARDGNFRNFEEDGRLGGRDAINRPVYKPEYWEIVQDNDYWANWRDPFNFCLPYGVPRLGPPTQILEIRDQPVVEFLYSVTFHPFNPYRLVPTDGRKHDPLQVALESYAGDPVGHWEGDTLVVESIGFTDVTWLSGQGWIHGFNMKVTERLTRKGNTIRWEATVEDPDYLQQPWQVTPRTIYLNTDPKAFLAEALPCDQRVQEPWGTEDKPTGSHVH